MRKDDMLGLFLRGLGAWEVVQSIAALPAIVAGPLAALFLIARLIVGLILFFGAGYFVEMAYGTRPEKDLVEQS